MQTKEPSSTSSGQIQLPFEYSSNPGTLDKQMQMSTPRSTCSLQFTALEFLPWYKKRETVAGIGEEDFKEDDEHQFPV